LQQVGEKKCRRREDPERSALMPSCGVDRVTYGVPTGIV